MELAEGQVHGDDDAEPDQIPVEVDGDRHQQRQEDEEDGNGVEKHAGDQQQRLDADQHDDFRQAGAEHRLGQLVEGAECAARPGEDTGQGDHGEDDRRQFRRFHQDVVDVVPAEVAIDQGADRHAVEHRHHSGLGGREQAAADAAEDDHRRRQAPAGFLHALPEGRPDLAALGLEPVPRRQPPADQKQGNAREDTGNQAGGEQCRYRGLGHQQAVDDEGDRGRDQDAGRAGGGNDAGREGARIAGLDHRRQHDGAHCCRVGRSGAGDAAHDHGHDDGDDGQATAALADNCGGKANDGSGDTGALENQPGDDEHRDGHQRVLGDAGIDVGRQGHHAQTAGRYDGGTGEAHGDAERYAGEHQHDEDAEQQPIHYLLPLRNTPSKRTTMSSDNTGRDSEYHHWGTPSDGEVTSKR